MTSFRTIAQSAHVFRGLATDGTNAYFAEVRFSVDALLVAPLAGGGAREMALPWEGRVDLFVFDTLAGPPSLLVGKRTSATEGFELWRLPLEGGAPSRLSGVPRVATARASRAGDRVAYVPSPEEAGAGGLYVAESGGRSERVVAPEEGAYREVVGWALSSLGLDANDVAPENLERAKPVLAKWLPLVKVYDSISSSKSPNCCLVMMSPVVPSIMKAAIGHPPSGRKGGRLVSPPRIEGAAVEADCQAMSCETAGACAAGAEAHAADAMTSARAQAQLVRRDKRGMEVFD